MLSSQLTVIIPTLADTARSGSLMLAIESVAQQKDFPIEILVVVNGSRFDSALVSHLESRSDLKVVKLAKPSLSHAIHQGRSIVSTPFFSFLDDDDQYLPDSIRKRLTELHDNPTCTMVASSGFRQSGGRRTASAGNLSRALGDPYTELVANNWMTSCGAIFRTSLVPADIFKNIPSHYEWTYLAYKILPLGPFCIVDEPCYIINDTPGSLSKTSAYAEAPVKVFREILKLRLPLNARLSVMRRLCMAEHDLSTNALLNGFRAKAIKHHIKSLLLPSGLKYLSFSRHLLLAKVEKSKQTK